MGSRQCTSSSSTRYSTQVNKGRQGEDRAVALHSSRSERLYAGKHCNSRRNSSIDKAAGGVVTARACSPDVPVWPKAVPCHTDPSSNTSLQGQSAPKRVAAGTAAGGLVPKRPMAASLGVIQPHRAAGVSAQGAAVAYTVVAWRALRFCLHRYRRCAGWEQVVRLVPVKLGRSGAGQACCRAAVKCPSAATALIEAAAMMYQQQHNS